MSEEEIRDLYGIEGEHWGVDLDKPEHAIDSAFQRGHLTHSEYYYRKGIDNPEGKDDV